MKLLYLHEEEPHWLCQLVSIYLKMEQLHPLRNHTTSCTMCHVPEGGVGTALRYMSKLEQLREMSPIVYAHHAQCFPLQQWQMHFALTSAALHFCCLTAHLYAEQIFTDVAAVTQTCCEPVLQSNTDQGGNALCLDQCCTVFLLAHCTPE